MTITVRQGQSYKDVAIMATGTMESVMQICAANNVSISDIPTVGAVLIVPDDAVMDTAALAYLKKYKIVIATAPPEGAGRYHDDSFEAGYFD